MPIKINKEKLAKHIYLPKIEDKFCNDYRESKGDVCPHCNLGWEECDLFNEFIYRDSNRYIRCDKCLESFKKVKNVNCIK